MSCESKLKTKMHTHKTFNTNSTVAIYVESAACPTFSIALAKSSVSLKLNPLYKAPSSE